jgi:diguanylate cyclase (GGDEF)-like protein/PAS domain S-box-containing protein
MADRAELVEAALDVYPEGLALLDPDERVVFWNRAAEVMTGYPGAEVVGRLLPDALAPLAIGRDCEMHPLPRNGPQPGRGSLVHAQHKMGTDVPAIARRVVLRDGLGARIGTAAVFHPGEQFSALPHGETSEVQAVRESQSELEDRLTNEFEMFLHEGVALSVLWIAVDQAGPLRKTHGQVSCETMLETVERTLANGLHPGEEVGRWGDNEFLVLSHERATEALAAHAQMLAGLARTADFRWWGDRVSLTVSVGAAAGDTAETLAELLDRAHRAMEDSARVGGNHFTIAPPRRQAPVAGDTDVPGRLPCSPS